MKTLLSVFSLAAGLLMVAGCSTPQSRIEKNPDTYARFTPEQQRLVQAGQIAIGFDADMVKLALGKPDYVNQMVDQNGANEIWSYVTYESYGDPFMYGGYYGGYGGYYPYRRGYYGGYGGYYRGYYPYYPLAPSALAYPSVQVERMRSRVVFRGGRVVSFENQVN